jgi:hypothetical protein
LNLCILGLKGFIEFFSMDYLSTAYLFSQVLAFIAMVIYIVGQQHKGRNAILMSFVVGNLFNAAHFLLLGAMTGVAMAVIGAVRFAVSIFSIHRLWLAFFLVVNTVALYLFFETPALSLTAYTGATFVIISSFLKSDSWMRVFVIIGAFIWMVYAVLVGSIVEVIANAFFWCSGVVGWYRHVHLVRSKR